MQEKIKEVMRHRLVITTLTALASVAGTHMATEWPAVWQAMCLT